MASTKDAAQPSAFYLACRNNDVEFVKEYLNAVSPEEHEVNSLEPSVNSTPLHAASCYGHKEIVQLLIEYRCDRSQINGYGLTAYEEAANDEIRQLFKRPDVVSGVRRFQDEANEDCFDFVNRPEEDTEETVFSVAASPPDNPTTASVQGYKTNAEKQLEIGYATTSIAMCQSKLGRFIADKFQNDEPMSLKTIGIKLQDIIDKELIAKQDPESRKANELLNKFLSDHPDGRIEHLIRLYTLETGFYIALKRNPMPLALPLYMTLQTLKDRYFQGQSYRSAKMTDEDIANYEWAANNQGSVLQTKRFSSTSLTRPVAEEFADTDNKNPDAIRENHVVFVYNFPERCDQAINLSRISDTQPCLSEFEDEAEILILPWTLFKVENVQKQSSLSYTIYLSNVLLPRQKMFSSLKWILKHPKGCIKRFHEHFPAKQPENTVKQLVTDSFMFD